MAASLLVFMEFIKQKGFKWLILILLLVGSIYVGASRIYANGVEAGMHKQEAITLQLQVKAKQEFDILQALADKDRDNLNTQIQELIKEKSLLKSKLEEKNSQINKESVDYAKTTTGSMSCFAPNDDGLRIINKSFPDSY